MINITSKVKALASKMRKLLRPQNLNNDPELQAYSKSIDAYNAAQSNYEMLDAIRQYNHTIINALDSIRPLQGLRILDIGASPHGYALEKVLALGAKEYVGIGLDINEDFVIETKTAHARLAYMNAESLSFNDNEFDAIVTMSTFEHIGNLNKALSEFHRVLKQGGCVLISFEPLWTCSYGHHLHHLGEISKLVPDWGHLLYSKNEMLECLNTCWPANAPLSVQEAGEWIYDGDCLNRKGILEIRKTLSDCQLRIEWIVPMMDESRNESQLTAAIEKTGLTRDDLMAKGLSILLYKDQSLVDLPEKNIELTANADVSCSTSINLLTPNVFYLASYPRSGNTWLRNFIEFYFDRKVSSLYAEGTGELNFTGTQTVFDINSIFLEYCNDHEPIKIYNKLLDNTGCFLNGNLRHILANMDEHFFIKTHEMPFEELMPNESIIYVVRHPEIVLMSYYMYLKDFGADSESVTLDDVIWGRTPFGLWSEHVEAWLKKGEALGSRFQIIRYETIANEKMICEQLSQLTGLSYHGIIGTFPSFKYWKKTSPKFYRKGAITHDLSSEFFSIEQRDLIKKLHGEAARKLGYELN